MGKLVIIHKGDWKMVLTIREQEKRWDRISRKQPNLYEGKRVIINPSYGGGSGIVKELTMQNVFVKVKGKMMNFSQQDVR